MPRNASDASHSVNPKPEAAAVPERAVGTLQARLNGLMTPLLIIGGGVVLDRLTKVIAETFLEFGIQHPVLSDFFRLSLWYNEGAAFGIHLGGRWVHIALSLAAMALVSAVLWHAPKRDRLGRTGLALIIGGAIGNLWDRLAAGKVTDFIDIGVSVHRWPTFNLADSFVVVGIGLLLLSYILHSHHEDDQLPGTENGSGASPRPDAGDAGS